ncbi:MAG: hypothetical protein H7067_12595 [Burkholderiales bacterium]|nr:hypothetical protein [Opitutaceae bacterium]
MKTFTSLLLGLPTILLASTLFAQTDATTSDAPGSPARTTPPPSSAPAYESAPISSCDAEAENRQGGYGVQDGENEFTLAGTGSSSDSLDDSAGGLSASYGWYLNETLLLSVRQSVDYINPDSGDDSLAGTTAVAIDHHFGSDRVRPFIGASTGFLYGDEIDDSLFAGLEGGLKFYVQPRTFLFALVEYIWSFEDSDDADDTFSDGGFRWTAGVGFNF